LYLYTILFLICHTLINIIRHRY